MNIGIAVDIEVATIKAHDAQLLVNEIHSFLFEHPLRKIITIEYVYDSKRDIYVAFINYEKEKVYE